MKSKSLTRSDMLQIIRQRGSVEYDGRLISDEESLPSEADLVGNDPARAAEVAEQIRSEIAALQQQYAKLEGLRATQDSLSSGSPAQSQEDLENMARLAARAGGSTPLGFRVGDSFLNDNEQGAATSEEVHPARIAPSDTQENFGDSGVGSGSLVGSTDTFGLSQQVEGSVSASRDAANESVKVGLQGFGNTEKGSSKASSKKEVAREEKKAATRSSSATDLTEGK